MALTYRPPKAVQEEGRRALEWIAAGRAGDGFTDVGRARAAQLAGGDSLSLDTVLRMYSYLARHEVDKTGAGFSPTDDNYPSPGRVAWAAWGGDPGLAWSTRIHDEAGQAASIGEDVTEKRDLPPSYRPSDSADVPVFRPACASCEYFCSGVDPSTLQAVSYCKRWDAPVAPDSYCDAWEAEEECLPVWLSDDEDEDDEDGSPTGMYDSYTGMNAAAPSMQTRAVPEELPLEAALTTLTNAVFAFYARAHEAHWNVAGADFAEYHALFLGIYDDVHDSVDGFAENLRKIGSLAPALVVEARDVTATDPRELATILLGMNEELVGMIRAAFDIATAAGEQGIANFLAERQDKHAMWGWQLRSSLGIAQVRDGEPDMEHRADPARLGVGTWVSWSGNAGRARGKVEKVVTKGPATASTGYTLEAIPEAPAYLIRLYEEKGNGYAASDVVVVHRADSLTVIGALPAPRSWSPEMELRWHELRAAAGIAPVEERRIPLESDRRTFTTELRAAATDSGVRISGYAAMWDREADGLPFREVIKRGAFADSLSRGDDVFLLVNHDTDQLPLARRSAGTLRLAEDDLGLNIEADLDPSNPRAAELASALERGDVDKMSFAFRVAADGSTKTEDGVRELRALDLYEVSVVTWPAYGATTVGRRSAADLDLAWRAARVRLAHLAL